MAGRSKKRCFQWRFLSLPLGVLTFLAVWKVGPISCCTNKRFFFLILSWKIQMLAPFLFLQNLHRRWKSLCFLSFLSADHARNWGLPDSTICNISHWPIGLQSTRKLYSYKSCAKFPSVCHHKDIKKNNLLSIRTVINLSGSSIGRAAGASGAKCGAQVGGGRWWAPNLEENPPALWK